MGKFLVTMLVATMMMISIVEGATVETIGHGIDEPSAIRAALRQAIEHELGLLVDSRTLIQNNQLIENEIRLKSSGFVESYEIISSRVINGEYEVDVRAEVRSDRLRSELLTLLEKRSIVETGMNDPRIKVLAFDQTGRELLDVENEFIEALRAQGFSRMLERTESSDYVVRIVIDGEMLAARLVAVDSGEIVASQTSSVKRRMFTDTRAWTIRNCARILAQAALSHAAQMEQHVTLEISEPTVENINRMIDRLRSIEGVHDIFRRSLDTLDVNYDGAAAELAKELERQGVLVRELSSSMIKI